MIPARVTIIGDDAFYYSALTSVSIPAGVTSIGYSTFMSCPLLTAITVGAANVNFSSLSGVLFNKAQTILIQYTGGKTGSYSIPAGVTSIGDSAFAYCTNLAFAVFTGNAPGSFGSSVFANAVSGFTIHYGNGSTGFTSPTWRGYPAVATVPPVPTAVITGGASQVTATTGT
jgi:hypothetical protein